MECRSSCGACCIAPSISSSIPGMPNGKPAGVRCVNLTEENLCNLFNDPRRPEVCAGFMPEALFCGSCRSEAMEILTSLEKK